MNLSSIVIENERVDDIPLILEQLSSMNVQPLFDSYYPAHWNWKGLSPGWTIVIWLTHILSESDHRMYTAEDWTATHQRTLEACTGQTIRPLDLSDDRLGRLLTCLGLDERWDAFHPDFVDNQIRTYRLDSKTVRHDSTTAYSYSPVTTDSLFQLGVSKDRRPDLGQIKAMFSSLEPLGLPLVMSAVPGNSADDPLYVPAIEAVRDILGNGLLHVADCKMAAIDTRARIADGGDDYLCPLPKIQQEDMDVYLDPVKKGDVKLTPIERTDAKGKCEIIAEGYERKVTLSHTIDDRLVKWEETQWVVRSFAFAKSQQAAIEKRVDKATDQLCQLLIPKQGKKRPKTKDDVWQAVEDILQRHRVNGLVQIDLRETVTERQVRAYKNKPARIEYDHRFTLKAETDTEALNHAREQSGWRIYGSSSADLTMTEAVMLYRQQDTIEHIFSRLKGKPLSLKPFFFKREDHKIGLLRLLTLAVSVLLLVEFVLRRQLKKMDIVLENLKESGKTNRPTTEKVLKTFQDITLTVTASDNQTRWHITPLSEIQIQILDLMDFSTQIYEKMNRFVLKNNAVANFENST